MHMMLVMFLFLFSLFRDGDDDDARDLGNLGKSTDEGQRAAGPDYMPYANDRW